MKKYSFIGFTLAILAIVSGCSLSAPSKTVQQQEGTVKTIFADAKSFVQSTYPQAVFIGYNSRNTTIDRPSIIPNTQLTTGTSHTWFYFFAKTPESIADKIINDSEAVVIQFSKGTLSMLENPTVRELELSDGAVTGDDILRDDSDVLLQKALSAVESFSNEKPTLFHADWRMFPNFAEITIFTSAKGGYGTIYDYKTGEINYVTTVNFI